MTPINYMSEQPEDYAKALTDADTLPKLVKTLDEWERVAADARKVVHSMTAEDFATWRDGLAKERKGDFAGEEWALKYGVVTMPEVLFKVSLIAQQYGVPWGCAYIRLRDSGNLERALA